MKKLGLFLGFCLMLSMLHAQTQTFFYSRKGEKIVMEKNETVWYVHFTPNANTRDKETVLNEIGALATSIGQITPDIYRCDIAEKPVADFTDIVEKVAIISSYSSEYRLPNSGTLHWTVQNLYVKVKAGYAIEQAMQMAGIMNQTAVPVDLLPHTFHIMVEGMDIFQACRLLFETGIVEYAQPSFYFLQYAETPVPDASPQTTPSDWNLRGIEGETMGINAVNAWNITTGDPGIKVAILDDGVMNNHPALTSGVQSGYTSPELLFSQTADGMPDRYDFNGTQVAGIIASGNNTQGNWGVAKNVAITSVRVRSNALVLNGSNPPTYACFSSEDAIVNGLQWAMNQGVDVVNISWELYNISGLYNPSIEHAPIQEAFNRLAETGRGGKGVVIVTCSGDNDAPSVSAPASMNGVIAVGATTTAGYRVSSPYPYSHPLWWGSNYGIKLDVVAPGEHVSTTNFYSSNNMIATYTSDYDRTRAAAAHVSGVAALILSVNPDLTASQVKDIIEQTAYKAHKDEPYPYASSPARPNGDWCEEMGYGLVNAEKAVHRARCFMNVPTVQGMVTQSTTWDTPMQAIGDITIPADVTLTVTSTLMCDYNVSITVAPKGRLIIDGGTLTSSCNDKMWQGIKIDGNPADVLQKESEQGKVQLIDGTVIKNARIGTLVDAGGILTAANAQFINCGTSVEFKPYTRMKSNTNFSEMNNKSSFTNCEFAWDSGLIEEGTSVLPYIHIKLSGVGNITFNGCTFRSHASLNRNTHGIYAYNSGLTVTPIMRQFVYPPTIEKRPLFENFTYGIRYEKPAIIPVPKYIPNKSLTVKHSDFTGVVRGILNSHAHNSTIQYNRFVSAPAPSIKCLANYMSGAEAQSLSHDLADVFSQTVFQSQLSTGITLNASTGYLVQGNTFTQLETGKFYGIGIYVQNSGGAPNTIDNNTFDFLHRGIVSNGINQSHPRFGGLQLLCNTFSDTCQYAITINPTGIAYIQGSSEKPAGNRFSHLNRRTAGNILSVENSLLYYYNQNIPEENPNPQGGNYISSIISLTPVNQPARCGLSTGFEQIERAELYNLLDSGKTRYANLQYTYSNLIDGGSTSQLLAELELSWDKTAWEIRDDLLTKSPYLSSDVIVKVAEQGILPHAMLLEVCIANPDATRNGDLLDVLRYKIANPMPEYMCNMIVASWDVKTFRTILEASLISAALDIEYASRQLINLYTADTLSNIGRSDSIISILEKLPNIEAVYDLADIHAGMDNFVLAYEKMDGLLKSELSDNARKEVGAMLDWYEFMEDYVMNVPLGDTLSPDHVETLQNLAATETKAGERAKSMLYYHSGCTYHYHIEPLLPDDTKTKSMKNVRNLQDVLNEEYNKVSVYPNPAQAYTTFTYELQPDAQNCILQISDIKGIVVLSTTLNGNTGHYLWDTRSLSSGNYIYTITSNEKKLNSGKVIVAK